MPTAVARQIFDTDFLQQSSAYLPGAAQEIAKTTKHRVPGKRETVIRKGNGKTWEDPTLLDWDPSELCCQPPFSRFPGSVVNVVDYKLMLNGRMV